MKNQVKQVLRVGGHALGITIHERLNLFQEMLNELQQQNIQLAQNHTALLQSSLFLVQRASVLTEEVAAVRTETRRFLDEHTTHQICIETRDYATTNPEIGLLSYLYSYLPSRKAIDIGAHTGVMSEYLLRAGYEVYAFEPFPESYERLVSHLGAEAHFHAHNLALGSADTQMALHTAVDLSGTRKYDDASVFHSLSPHAMPDDLPFRDAVMVPVKTLAGLHDDKVVPEDIAIVKIDTEGHDLEVIRGMGNRTYPVVGVEYWDTGIPFGKSGLLYTCESMVEEMRRRGYHWYLVIFRVWGQNRTGYYCNHDRPVPESWGNIYFFREREVFAHARDWCAAALPHTYFRPAPAESGEGERSSRGG